MVHHRLVFNSITAIAMASVKFDESQRNIEFHRGLTRLGLLNQYLQLGLAECQIVSEVLVRKRAYLTHG